MEKDYYRILGVRQADSPHEVRRAFKSHCLQFHLSLSPEDPVLRRHFAELAEAFEVLNDSHKRALYDHLGHHNFTHGVVDRFGNRIAGFQARKDLGQVYQDFREARPEAARSIEGIRQESDMLRAQEPDPNAAPKDVHVVVAVTLPELMTGKIKEIEYSRSVVAADGLQTVPTSCKKFPNQIPVGPLWMGLSPTHGIPRRGQRAA